MQRTSLVTRVLATLIPSALVLGIFALGGGPQAAEACAACSRGYCMSTNWGSQLCYDGGGSCMEIFTCPAAPCPWWGCGGKL